MDIRITQDQHQFLVDLLAENIALWVHEAAGLLRSPAGRALGEERLEKIRAAEELFEHLTR